LLKRNIVEHQKGFARFARWKSLQVQGCALLFDLHDVEVHLAGQAPDSTGQFLGMLKLQFRRFARQGESKQAGQVRQRVALAQAGRFHPGAKALQMGYALAIFGGLQEGGQGYLVVARHPPQEVVDADAISAGEGIGQVVCNNKDAHASLAPFSQDNALGLPIG
jgi:hypothetical protein